MTDKDKKPPVPLRVVSENPHAAAEKKAREIRQAKAEAERTLVVAAAALLRLIAGGEPTSYNIRAEMIRAFLAEDKLRDLSGQGFSPWDTQSTLTLPVAELHAEASDNQRREWRRERGMQDIVQGSLRLAAHQLLGERPHFGGKHSERVIENGITAVRRAFDPAPNPLTKKQLAADKAARKTFNDLMKERIEASVRQKPPARKKRWSPLDSRSYLDPKPED